jgi:hypothetical protein
MREYWAIWGVEVGPVTDSVSVESDNFCEFFSVAVCVSSALKALVDAANAEIRRGPRRKKERMEVRSILSKWLSA